MRRSGSRSGSVSVFVLIAFWAATLATTPARADLPFPSEDPFVGSGPAAPAAATPPPITPVVPPAVPAQPIELREVFWGDRHGRLRHGPFPFQGNRPLEGAALYRTLGREDLARAYESRGEAKIALAIASMGAIVIGAMVMASARPETQCDTPPRYSLQPPVCQTDWKGGTVAAGIGITLLGPALLLVAGFGFATEPVSPAERQRLIDSFNASLMHATEDGAPSRPRPAALRFTASPTFSSSGAGLTVGARF